MLIRFFKINKVGSTYLIAILFFLFALFFFVSQLKSFLHEPTLQDKDKLNTINDINKDNIFSKLNKNSDLYLDETLSEYRKWIQSMGAQDAYLRFLQHAKTLDIYYQHGRAHYFGEALFLEKGKGGIIFCDYSFNYGCQHGLIGRLIEQKGFSGLKELSSSCHYDNDNISITDSSICMHGAGHGLVATLGYTREGLEESLRICEGIFSDYTNEDIANRKSCHGGAFMEYNFRSMLDFGGTSSVESVRPIEEDLYYPCLYLNIDDGANKVCWPELSSWWFSVLVYSDQADKYREIVYLCENIPGEMSKWESQCARGVGRKAGKFTNSEIKYEGQVYSDPKYLYDTCSLFIDERSLFECVLEGFIWFAKNNFPIEKVIDWCSLDVPVEYKEKCLLKIKEYYAYYKLASTSS